MKHKIEVEENTGCMIVTIVAIICFTLLMILGSFIQAQDRKFNPRNPDPGFRIINEITLGVQVTMDYLVSLQLTQAGAYEANPMIRNLGPVRSGILTGFSYGCFIVIERFAILNWEVSKWLLIGTNILYLGIITNHVIVSLNFNI